MNIRQLALSLLNEYEVGAKYVNLSLSSHSADKLAPKERAALTVLLYTAVERKITYDYLICSLSGRSIDKVELYTRNILRLGLCQVLDMKSVPDFAAVNETVKLCRSAGEKSFVNGILRAAVRNKDNLSLPDANKNYRRYLSVKYSFPLWIVKLLDSCYGSESTESMLRFFNEEKYTDLTVNTIKTSAEDFANRLREAGYPCEISADCPISVRLLCSVNPENIPGFADGEFFVQDRACAISAMALDPKPGDLIVDTCACPGGKSFASAILSRDSGKIYSFDIHDSKLSLITDSAQRLSLNSIITDQCDAECPCDDLLGKADKVICDAPCSGLGVLGKKPDLRYKDESIASSLPALQLSILEKSAGYLRAGGELIYSTCTLNPAENEDVVNAFLAENPEFSKVPFSVGSLKCDGGMMTLLPHVHNTDGFFMAKIIKNG